MSITEEFLLTSAPRNGTLSHASPGDRGKTVAWLCDMYRNKRKPLVSLMRQADAARMGRGEVISNVLLACRPGGHSPELEDAKARFMRDYKNQGRRIKA